MRARPRHGGVCAARASTSAADLITAIERECRPEALLIDVNCWGAAIVAEASGLPWAMYSPYLLATPSRDAPPSAWGCGGGQESSARLVTHLLRRATRPMFRPRRRCDPRTVARALRGAPDRGLRRASSRQLR